MHRHSGRARSIYTPVDPTERAKFYTDIKPHLNDATYRL
jgi:hypothetical protein